MPKVISLALATVLTIIAVSLWFKSNVSETAAGPRSAIHVPWKELQHKDNVNVRAVRKMNDKTSVFTTCNTVSDETSLGLCTVESAIGRW